MNIKIVIISMFCLLLNPIVVTQAETENVAINLQVPWEISKDGNTFLITERTGNIVEVKDGIATRYNVQLKKQLSNKGEGGLLGFQLHPTSNDRGFIYYTYVEGNNLFNRVTTVRKGDNNWIEENLLLDRIPGAVIHNGGRIKIGPDGMLYVTTGDAAQEMLAQSRSSLAGKILRMELNGQVPVDNPFQGSYIYSFGHRNPQGLAWDEEGTKLYASEHGPIGFDEINEIVPGGNYGWPIIKGNETRPTMKTPLFHSGNNTWAPAGMDFRNNVLYVAALRGSQLLAFNLGTNKVTSAFANVGRIRDVLIDEDNFFIVTSNTDGRGNPAPNDDRVIKIEDYFKE
jgi:glucose/arabinose dehydrogenase